MNIGDVLKGLHDISLEKFLVLMGFFGLFIAFTVDVKVITNSQLALLSGGILVLGLGIWKGTRGKMHFFPHGVLTTYHWESDPLGCLFIILFFVLIGLFVVSLFNSSSSVSTIPISSTNTPIVTTQVQPTASVTLTP